MSFKRLLDLVPGHKQTERCIDLPLWEHEKGFTCSKEYLGGLDIFSKLCGINVTDYLHAPVFSFHSEPRVRVADDYQPQQPGSQQTPQFLRFTAHALLF